MSSVASAIVPRLQAHPIVSLLALLVLAVAVHALATAGLLCLLALICTAAAVRGELRPLALSAWRLKYLLAILILTFAVLDGTPRTGLRHALVLLVLATAVQLQFLLHSTEECGAALTRLLRPLGPACEPVGRRLALTLSMVPALLDRLREARRGDRDLLDRLAEQVRAIEATDSVLPAELPELAPPPRAAWLLLLAWILLLVALLP